MGRGLLSSRAASGGQDLALSLAGRLRGAATGRGGDRRGFGLERSPDMVPLPRSFKADLSFRFQVSADGVAMGKARSGHQMAAFAAARASRGGAQSQTELSAALCDGEGSPHAATPPTSALSRAV